MLIRQLPPFAVIPNACVIGSVSQCQKKETSFLAGIQFFNGLNVTTKWYSKETVLSSLPYWR